MTDEEEKTDPEEGTETMAQVGSPLARGPIAARITVIDGAREGSFVLRDGTCRIGSAPDSDLVADDATVSRLHLELTLDARGVSLVDRGSHNGTFYLGQRVERMSLSLGSHVRIGRVTIAIDADQTELDPRTSYPGQSYARLFGRSPPMRVLFSRMLRLEGSLVPVLVDGESGVGKELVARALHDRSKVASGPFQAVNCGALPRELVASELFGHRRGAFTGAHEAREGAFQAADGGTLFLDEIGELPLDVQPVLLRALETSEVRPVGSNESRRVQVRIVAATNRDLAEEINAGRFRADLFYRLAVVRLGVPSLRDRPEDVPLLADEFASSIGVTLPADVREKIAARPYPGNVRELRNVVLSYAALGELPARESREGNLEGALVDLVDVHRPYLEQKNALVERFTAAYLRALLAETGGNQSQAARIAGLDRGYLGRLLGEHGIKKR